ncbi:MAG TPA: hypothetical protein VD902_07865 [Symbiobacteriaceae bacterium]|nr:hypothetical protein [Symbiobacteriaceae bacterium]
MSDSRLNEVLEISGNTSKPAIGTKNSVAAWLRGIGFVFLLIGILSLGISALFIIVASERGTALLTALGVVGGFLFTSLSFYAFGEIIRLLHEINQKLGEN